MNKKYLVLIIVGLALAAVNVSAQSTDTGPGWEACARLAFIFFPDTTAGGACPYY